MKKETKKLDYLSNKNMAIFWIIIIIITFFIGGIELAFGILLASIISFIIVNYMINSEWSGTITEIKSQNVYDQNNEDYKSQTFAFVKLTNGKTKKLLLMPGWKMGDKIVKEKGELSHKKIN